MKRLLQQVLIRTAKYGLSFALPFMDVFQCELLSPTSVAMLGIPHLTNASILKREGI